MARLLAGVFLLAWLAPLMAGTWLGWGTDLLLTPWDALTMTVGVAFLTWESALSIKRVFTEL